MSDLRVAATVATRGVSADFAIAAGETLALIGPNGSGKSTLAGVIAGLVPAQPATVRVGSRTVTDSARGIDVAARDRRVGLLAQQPLLFPHMTVADNVAFAARQAQRRNSGRRQSERRQEARARATAWLKDLGVADLAGRRPAELSGGQAQRVALARALAAEPEVLVLDEPLAGLDVEVAAAVRTVLARLLARRSVLLITHDLLDVLTLADRVAVLEDGRITEAGTVPAVLAAPRSRFAARLAGVNVVRGVLAEPGALRGSDGRVWHAVPGEGAVAGQHCVAVFRPADVAVYRSRPDGSPRNTVEVRIAALEPVGAAVRIRADGEPDGNPGLAADVTAEAVADMGLGIGDEVWFAVKSQAIALHPAPPRTSSVR